MGKITKSLWEEITRMKKLTGLILSVSIFSYFCVAGALKTVPAEVVGVWLFDEGNGNTVIDASGNGHDGEIIGEVEWVDGKFEKALAFNGGHVLVPHEDVMNLRQWTITAWIKVPKVVEPYQIILGKEAWPNRNYTMWIRPGVMTFGFTLPGGAQDLQVGSREVTDNKWHFVAGVYDEKNLIPYVDGEQFNPRGAAGKPATSNAPLIIGAQGPDGKGGPLKGMIDEVAVYDTALDEDELADVMESLTKQFQAVEAVGKLTVTWGDLKEK